VTKERSNSKSNR